MAASGKGDMTSTPAQTPPDAPGGDYPALSADGCQRATCQMRSRPHRWEPWGVEGNRVPVRIRGIVVPALLLSLLMEGRWRHPGESALACTMPWFKAPVHFLTSVQGTGRLRSDALPADRGVVVETPRRSYGCRSSDGVNGARFGLRWLRGCRPCRTSAAGFGSSFRIFSC